MARAQESRRCGGDRITAGAGQAIQAQGGFGECRIVIGIDRRRAHTPQQRPFLRGHQTGTGVIELLSYVDDETVRVGDRAAAQGIHRRRGGARRRQGQREQ